MKIQNKSEIQKWSKLLQDLLLALIVLFSLTLFFVSNAFSITSNISPDHISVNSLYHGSKVVINGETAADKEIIIKISSPDIKASLRKKGKAVGMLWMNIGELEFEGVPDVYLIYTTQDINRILSENEQVKYTIGYDAFKRLVDVSPVTDNADKEKWIEEFIRFKEKDNVYGVFSGKIETGATGDKKTYTLTLDWPYEAPPQEYRVNIYAVKGGAVQDQTESALTVKKVGALKFLSNMAFNNAVVYGVISIIIAIAAGFIVSLIFKGGGKGGH